MSEEIPIGPNRCEGCGGEYGFHYSDCYVKSQEAMAPPALQEQIKALEARVKVLERATPNPSWVGNEDLDYGVRGRWKRPTLVECEETASKMGMGADEGEKFWHFYESKGWKVGRNAMKSWVSALANWKKGWEEKQGKHQVTTMSVWEMTKVVEAKEKLANKIRGNWAAEVATGWMWSSEAQRLKYVELKKEIKALNEQIARMG